MFVRTSGPTVAKTSSAQISHPTSQSCSLVCGIAGQRKQPPRQWYDDCAHARRRVHGHERRDRDGVRGPRRADPEAEEDPRRTRPRPRFRTPTATSPTPTNETAAPSQKRPLSCSRPSARPKSAAKIGMAPRMRPIVDAVVMSSAKTKQTWLSQSTTAANASTGRCRRSIRSVRSTRSGERDEDRSGERVADRPRTRAARRPPRGCTS